MTDELDTARSVTYQIALPLSRLMRAVTTDYGWIVDDEAEKLYERLRASLVIATEFLDNNDDDLVFDVYGLVHYAMPDELYSDCRWSEESTEFGIVREYEEWFAAILEAADELEQGVKALFEATGKKLVPLSPTDDTLVGRAEDVTKRIERRRAELLSRWGTELTAVADSVALSDLKASLSFNFVKVDGFRDAIQSYTDEAIAALNHNLYRSSIVHAVAAIQGLLICALDSVESNAKIAYWEQFDNKDSERDRPPNVHRRALRPVRDIHKWNMHELLKISVTLRILITPDLDNFCRRANTYRNSVHIQAQGLSWNLGTSEALAVMGILGMVVKDVEHFLTNDT